MYMAPTGRLKLSTTPLGKPKLIASIATTSAGGERNSANIGNGESSIMIAITTAITTGTMIAIATRSIRPGGLVLLP
jgi:hypothetical protein